ncbi:MaoC/PaaZ C-terminal domain-containing protein [Haloarcula argentinensis]|uniref:Monoamine oxidase n=1 Tax=Haloarcula argentinensis TaxID=43776 RepID=A0A847UNZ8_HALAR|nr:MaoC/PaaZ C-terminal domain-containing protein [Haloarcula argentinensis]NLV13624.1 monoamine oxidase [Haloarcula argentinensis]
MAGEFDAVEVGDGFTTSGRTITEADVVNFAGVSGDFNHLHTNAERMADSGYGERIAHGALVFSVVTGLLWQARDEAEKRHMVAFYGIDRLRFIKPVFLGDTIHVETEIVDTEQRDHPVATGVVRTEVTALNQADDAVFSAEFLTLRR